MCVCGSGLVCVCVCERERERNVEEAGENLKKSLDPKKGKKEERK